MKNINRLRILLRNEKSINRRGDYVLYWMQSNRRFEYNYALEFAVEKANELEKALLIYEGLGCGHQWASERFHQFIIDGMIENYNYAQKLKLNYFSFIVEKPGDEIELFYQLAKDACIAISDEYPVYIIRDRNKTVE